MSGSRAANQEVPAGQARRADADEVRVTELPATGAAVASGHQGAPTSSWLVNRIADCSVYHCCDGWELSCLLAQPSRPQQCWALCHLVPQRNQPAGELTCRFGCYSLPVSFSNHPAIGRGLG